MFPRMRSRSTTNREAVSLRVSSEDDAGALARLAGLDSSRMPPGPMLLAEVDDDVRAAVSLADGTVLADPFHTTNDTIKLLRARAKELSR
jgi:hypothetical protein